MTSRGDVVLNVLDRAGGKKKNAGKNIFYQCRYHDDKNPSMCVDVDSGIFNCFSCGEKGDAIKLLMDILNVDLAEAKGMVGERGGDKCDKAMVMPNKNKNAQVAKKEAAERIEVAKRWWVGSLNLNMDTDSGLISYFENKNIDSLKIIDNCMTAVGAKKQPPLKICEFNDKVYLVGRVIDGCGAGVAVQVVDIASRDKKTYGVIKNPSAFLIKRGNPPYMLHVAEGITDALAIYSRSQELDIMCMGCLGAQRMGSWVDNAPKAGVMFDFITQDKIFNIIKKVVVHADGDEAGTRAASALICMLRDDGITSDIKFYEDGKDPCDSFGGYEEKI